MPNVLSIVASPKFPMLGSPVRLKASAPTFSGLRAVAAMSQWMPRLLLKESFELLCRRDVIPIVSSSQATAAYPDSQPSLTPLRRLWLLLLLRRRRLAVPLPPLCKGLRVILADHVVLGVTLRLIGQPIIRQSKKL